MDRHGGGPTKADDSGLDKIYAERNHRPVACPTSRRASVPVGSEHRAPRRGKAQPQQVFCDLIGVVERELSGDPPFRRELRGFRNGTRTWDWDCINIVGPAWSIIVGHVRSMDREVVTGIDNEAAGVTGTKKAGIGTVDTGGAAVAIGACRVLTTVRTGPGDVALTVLWLLMATDEHGVVAPLHNDFGGGET